MKTTNKFIALLLTMLFSGSFMFSATAYNPEGPAGLEGQTPPVYSATAAAILKKSDNPDIPYDDIGAKLFRYTKGEEIVSSVEEIEMPLRQKDYGKYYDDFNRRVDNEIRSDAKKLFIEQEKAKEITNLEDAIMPLIKKGGFNERDYYNCNYYVCSDYETNSALNKYSVAFYDSLGRKISDDLIEEAARMYEKQKRHKELYDWGWISVDTIWCYIWRTVYFIIILMIIFFVASLFYRKVIKKA